MKKKRRERITVTAVAGTRSFATARLQQQQQQQQQQQDQHPDETARLVSIRENPASASPAFISCVKLFARANKELD